MEHYFRFTTLSPQTVAFVRRLAPLDQAGAVLAQTLPTVWQYVAQQGVTPTGAPYARYLPAEGAQFVIEAGLPIPHTIPAHGEIEVSELPGGEVAEAVHVGPYDGVHATYEALTTWVETHGKQLNGAPWEIYVTDPGLQPDATKWETQIFWPVT
jgi:AraC family transcriptional regulator